MYTGIVGDDPVCNVVNYNRADSDLATDIGLSIDDCWRCPDLVGKYYANKLMKELIEGGFQFNVNWTGINYQLEVA